MTFAENICSSNFNWKLIYGLKIHILLWWQRTLCFQWRISRGEEAKGSPPCFTTASPSHVHCHITQSCAVPPPETLSDLRIWGGTEPGKDFISPFLLCCVTWLSQMEIRGDFPHSARAFLGGEEGSSWSGTFLGEWGILLQEGILLVEGIVQGKTFIYLFIDWLIVWFLLLAWGYAHFLSIYCHVCSYIVTIALLFTYWD